MGGGGDKEAIPKGQNNFYLKKQRNHLKSQLLGEHNKIWEVAVKKTPEQTKNLPLKQKKLISKFIRVLKILKKLEKSKRLSEVCHLLLK